LQILSHALRPNAAPRRMIEKIFGMFIPLLIIFGTFVTRIEVARDERRNLRKASSGRMTRAGDGL